MKIEKVIMTGYDDFNFQIDRRVNSELFPDDYHGT